MMRDLTRRDALKLGAVGLPLAASRGAEGQVPGRKKYLILSCDGGGIRGLLTARIIERLQAEVPFLDHVELFAGTSTGGIIALALADKISPSDLVGLYRDQGSVIFDHGSPMIPTMGLSDFTRPLLEKANASLGKLMDFLNKNQLNLNDLAHPKYPNEGLACVLSCLFGNRTFDQLKSGKPALVTTLRLCSTDMDMSWAPLVLHNLKHPKTEGESHLQSKPTPKLRLVDAALSTSAAPLYFPPHECPGFGYCVDGGLFANCPASIALGLVLGARAASFDDIRILSIGTGAPVSGIDIRNSDRFHLPIDYGAVAWLYPRPRVAKVGENKDKATLTPAFPLISALLDASSASHNYVCSQAMPDHYMRVQARLSRPVDLDDTSKDSLELLEQAAVSIPPGEWEKIKKWLGDQLV